MKNKVFFNSFNWFKQYVSLKYIFKIDIGDSIYKIAIVFDIGFFIITIYISINYFYEFIYVINLDDINILKFSSNDINHCEYSLNNMVSYDKSIRFIS